MYLHDRAMPRSRAKILVTHRVYNVGSATIFFEKKVFAKNEANVGGILTTSDANPIIVGGTDGNVHLHCALARDCKAPEIAQELKLSLSFEFTFDGRYLWD